ncbi:MAG: FUSC family protein [Pseudolabrys sp.]|jgi:hypothetical protein
MSDDTPNVTQRLHRRVPAGGYRRGLLFLVAIGIPLCVAVVLHMPAGGLIGAMTGLILSFADDEGALSRRLGTLATVAAGIAIGGVAGIALHGFPPSLWVLFAISTFASGWYQGRSKAYMLAARFGSMALVVTSGAPELRLEELAFAVGALAVVAVARVVDHLAGGPLTQPRGRPRVVPSGGWIRFALAYAAAATASLGIGIALDPTRVLWVVVTTLVVMQPDARLSYVLIVQRIAGTVLGVAAAFAVTNVVHSPWPIAAILLCVAPLIPHHLQNRYWLHTALIALLVLLAYDLAAAADPRILQGLFTERLQDVLLGGGIALIGTLFAFPRDAPEET